VDTATGGDVSGGQGGGALEGIECLVAGSEEGTRLIGDIHRR
jgi:hypothetical protein